jgi:hypothetical protein
MDRRFWSFLEPRGRGAILSRICAVRSVGAAQAHDERMSGHHSGGDSDENRARSRRRFSGVDRCQLAGQFCAARTWWCDWTKGEPAGAEWFISGAAQIAVLLLYLTLPAAFGASEVWPLLGKLSAVLVGVLLFQIFGGQQSWFVRTLESVPFREIGRISNGAYLIHNFIHFGMIESFMRYFGAEISAPRLAQFLAEFASSLLVAAISWHYLERPIIAWAARVTSRKPGTSANSAPQSPAVERSLVEPTRLTASEPDESAS